MYILQFYFCKANKDCSLVIDAAQTPLSPQFPLQPPGILPPSTLGVTLLECLTGTAF